MKITVQLGKSVGGPKMVFAGQSLNDDIYHSFVLRRRGTKVTAIVDDDDPVVGKYPCGCFFFGQKSRALQLFFAVVPVLFLATSAHEKTREGFP